MGTGWAELQALVFRGVVSQLDAELEQPVKNRQKDYDKQ